ncbi:hypothetical protein F4803DRAFT_543405 [Xylaria telfairii]|nr:hypothetical protein F4803DRAFT_543405 [Xylaria telfairii]
MVKLNWALAAAITARGAIATTDKLLLFDDLLKRQEPGSAAYNCHEACGQAISAARASKDVCNDDDFLINYDTCLKCSGPDNIDIWKIYGRTLSGFGESCGLSTTPASGDSTNPGSTTSTIPTSTVSAETPSSSISITAAPTASTATTGESDATSTVPTATTNGTAITTGAVPVNVADALSGNAFGVYAAAALGVLYAIAR